MATPTLPLEEMIKTLHLLQAFVISFLMLCLAVFPFVVIGMERWKKLVK